ncbi:LOW QUALITY PROTEIN: deleted in malignant brain tumors 1 protein-like [Colossoma macropomum]|uniref:LOW QUALITY PROTEIN: deleted in malignant brain tumors 1 protein-like n=1 Tax=Colossoma macropomum TaxID=42526 RepID=UPI0018652AB2|nr:LOW QUALITY PROTEIN: deleted in malignant brain tumors 1 protein-like [Colossoma macropomum]
MDSCVALIVLSSTISLTTADSVRLVDGGSRCAGRVEVLHNDQWGTVCDDGWGIRDAAVVCRELGCGNALNVLRDAHFGRGSGRIWMDNVDCSGSESTLKNCRSRGWGKHYCNHGEDAGVICSGQMLRLADGPHLCSGRVEVLHEENWSTMCDAGFDQQDAEVVCRELGCGLAVEVLGAAAFGRGEGQVWSEELQCRGNESQIYLCPTSSSLKHNCSHDSDVGLVCSGHTQARLVNSSDSCSGRVELQYLSEWGTVCDVSWDMRAASVLCGQLKCGSAVAVLGSDWFGEGSGRIWADVFDCQGNETHLSKCPISSWSRTACSHKQDAGIICSDSSLAFHEGRVRLSGGMECEGEVEVYFRQDWRRVLLDSWSESEASVVCRQLGCGSVLNFSSSSPSSPEHRHMCVTGFNCSGSEAHLGNCSSTQAVNCSSREQLSITCSGKFNSANSSIRLVGSGGDCAGRLEVFHSGSWGTVCDDLWDIKDAQVVCRQLQCGVALSDPVPAWFGPGTGPIWLDEVECEGNETSLWNCRFQLCGENECGHTEVVGVVCSEFKEIRLTEGCLGNLEVFYNGTWGNVCVNGMDEETASLICQELNCGRSGSERASKARVESAPNWLDDLKCRKHDSTLWQCPSSPWGQNKCDNSNEVARIICSEEDSRVLRSHLKCSSSSHHKRCSNHLPLRLRGGKKSCSGRLEVYYNKTWGSICDDQWDISDAQVVCRQLGCGPALIADGSPVFGGVGPIWLNRVKCRGNEIHLWDCPRSLKKHTDCSRWQDAEVTCAVGQTVNGTTTPPQNLPPAVPSIYPVSLLVLGVLLFLALAFLVMLFYQNRVLRRVLSKRGHKTLTEAVYEEINHRYTTKRNEPTQRGSILSEEQHSGYENVDEELLSEDTAENYDDSTTADQSAAVVTDYDDVEEEPQTEMNHSSENFCRWQFGELYMKSAVYRVKRNSAGTVPCGAPVLLNTMSDTQSHTLTYCGRLLVPQEPRLYGLHSAPRLLQLWYPPELQAQVEHLSNYPTQLICTGLKEPGADAIQTCSFPHFDLSELFHHLGCCKAHIGAGGLGAGGGSRCAGRVEVYRNRQWGTVCDHYNQWDMTDAAVVCRELDCGEAVGIPNFGPGSGQMLMGIVQCAGSESKLISCDFNPYYSYYCTSHDQDVGVNCSTRLTGGPHLCSGRVEVLHGVTWSTVCDADFDQQDAEVVCRELGCGLPLEVVGAVAFGREEGHVWSEELHCKGNESDITLCPISTSLKHNCQNDNHVGLVCSGHTGARLISGLDSCSGRVEIQYLSEWGTVCDVSWDMRAASVLCGQLKCGSAVAVLGSDWFGEGSGRIWADVFDCQGNETHLSECPISSWSRTACSHKQDAGVICSGSSLAFHEGRVRLSGGMECEGEVEVYIRQDWRRVLLDSWSESEASVVCRQLGCGSVISFSSSSPSSPEHSHMCLTGFNCSGSEAHLGNCSSAQAVNCSSREQLSITCSTIRLVGSGGDCAGRLEVFHKGSWGTVCDDLWDIKDAQVVCRQLQCGVALSALVPAWFGPGTGPIRLNEVECEGNETSLWNCRFQLCEEDECGHEEDVGVVCSEFKEFRLTEGCEGNLEVFYNGTWDHLPLRLKGTKESCSGRLEVYHNAEWGSVCDKLWDIRDAQVVCRQLGCGPALSANHTDCSHRQHAGVTCAVLSKRGHKTLTEAVYEEIDRRYIIKGNDLSHRGSILSEEQHSGYENVDEELLSEDVAEKYDDVITADQSSAVVTEDMRDIYDDAVAAGPNSNIKTVDTPENYDVIRAKQDVGGVKGQREMDSCVALILLSFTITLTTADSVRLVDGGSRCAGRVEVYRNGTWGTVCDYWWDMTDAAVVCRELGCGDALGIPKYGPGSGPILMGYVWCDGSESTLSSCYFNPFYGRLCTSHDQDSGVTCAGEKPRLTDGPHECAGRVEVFFNNNWASVCNAGFDQQDAEVVCRELGCGLAVEVLGEVAFGRGEGQVWSEELQCRGNESQIYFCPTSSSLKHNCTHDSDVGIKCSGHTGARLISGLDSCSGRVELQYLSEWGTVCDVSWDMRAASVLCGQLKCGSAVAVLGSDWFGEGSGQIWADVFDCQGNETHLSKCPISSWSRTACSHKQDAGVICSGSSLAFHEGQVRLSGGMECEGEVEVYFRQDWRRVLLDSWSESEASVVCRQLGCGSVFSFSSSSPSSPEHRHMCVMGFSCSGSEAHLGNCSSAETVNCSSREQLSITCSGKFSSAHSSIRLVGSGGDCAGRLEVFHSGSWGTVCDDLWDIEDAQVVCIQLQCGVALSALVPAQFGPGTGPIWLNEVECEGNETSLWNCRFQLCGEDECGHKEDVGVVCSEFKEIRLTEGCEGNLEVFYNGTWGNVCLNNMDEETVSLICQELNCGRTGSERATKARVESAPNWLDDLKCRKHDSTLWHCPSSPWRQNKCDNNNEVAHIICSEEENHHVLRSHLKCFSSSYQRQCSNHLPLRLRGGEGICSGRLEVYHNSEWGSICNDLWDTRDAQVVCRQLGCGPALSADGSAVFGAGEGPIWLNRVKCRGNEIHLWDCPHSLKNHTDCSHRQDAGVTCTGQRSLQDFGVSDAFQNPFPYVSTLQGFKDK